MNRKLLRISAAVISAVMLFAAAGCTSDSKDAVAVQSVAMITGTGSVGLADRYAGLVVSGNTEEIKLDESMTLKDILVEVGQTVNEGDVLFTYDNDALLLTLEQSRLEIEGMKNTITSNQNQIKELEKERSGVSGNDKLQYTLEIQTLEANIRETEYNIGVKEKELARQEELSKDTEVKATMSGCVTAINKDGGTDNNGDQLPFMTIIETDNLRIKGTINEMNRNDLLEGMSVVIRSRTDSTVTWSGKIDHIDWDNQVQSNNNYYYSSSSSDEMTSSSKYPFYVALDSYDGLFMGQHVYIEPGEGANDGDTASGLWLPAYFINDADTNPWVWAASSRDKLEKRQLKLGDYNAETDTYNVESGLTAEDYIAFPEDTLKEGAPVEKYDETIFPSDSGDDGGDGDVLPDEPVYSTPTDDMPVDDMPAEDMPAVDASIGG